MKISGNNILPVIVILCFLTLIFGSASVNNFTRSNKMVPRKRSIAALLFTSNASLFSPEFATKKKNRCRWLKGLKHQMHLCQRLKGLPELLQEIRKLALSSCEEQFRFEQWNCSSLNMKKFFKKIYRETSFMYSLATSAFMYLVSKACSQGNLQNCKCASHGRSDSTLDWQWGGCGWNTKYAAMFTKKFLQLNKIGDNWGNIIKYNSQVGIKVVRKYEIKECKCQGLSGACTLKVCWNRIEPFDLIAKYLKQLYHSAIEVKPNNNIRDLQEYSKKEQLMYLESPPNFCSPLGINGVTTVGRQCKDVDNCATLCCSRGYESKKKTITERCECRWGNVSTYQIKCKECLRDITLLYCK